MYDEYIEKLKKYLSENRFEHSIRTMQMAKKICDRYMIDESAVLAALLHDIAKELTLDEMIKIVGDDYKEDIDNMYTKNILHGYVGSIICKDILKIENEKVLSAIRYHTTGKKYMNDIEKVVYISDAIELGRVYENVENIREEVFNNLNRGILYELNHKIKYLIESDKVLHKNSSEFRNSLLQEIENEKI